MIKINHTLCDQCGTCISVCPHDALVFIANEKLCASEKKCVSCGVCVNVCPFGALNTEDRS